MEDQAKQDALAGEKNIEKIGLADDAERAPSEDGVADEPEADNDNSSDKKRNMDSNNEADADAEGTFPQFLAHHDPFQLLVDAGMSIATNKCLGGAIHIGIPSNPNKDSTMAYLIEKIGPVSLDFRKDEAGVSLAVTLSFISFAFI